MNQRRPAAEIMNGLTTKSDKIRALAQAGYDRTEINKVLDIRYQHASMYATCFCSPASPEACAETPRPSANPEVDAAPAPREDTSWTVLTEGFQFIGEWSQDPKSQIKLDAKAPTVPGKPSARTGVSLIFDFLT